MSLLHLTRQQAEAFLVAEKLTKSTWAVILGCIFIIGLFMLGSYFYFGELLGIYFVLLAAIAVIVYWVDVRPSVDQVQRGNK